MTESSVDVKVMPTGPLRSYDNEGTPQDQDMDDIALMKMEEQKLQAKYPNLGKTSQASTFLQKQLSKGMVFDSGDYNTAKAKVQSKKPLKPEEQLQLSMINNLPSECGGSSIPVNSSGANSPVVYSRSQSLTPAMMSSSTIGLGTSAVQVQSNPRGPVRKPSVTSQSRLAAS